MTGEPWSDFKDLKPTVPPAMASWLRELDEPAFVELIRGCLLPPTGMARESWAHLWSALSMAWDLTERTRATLNTWSAKTEDHLSTHPDDAAAKEFLRQCRNAEARLSRTAPPVRDLLKSPAYRLVQAIADHEASTRAAGEVPTPFDLQLWERGQAAARRARDR